MSFTLAGSAAGLALLAVLAAGCDTAVTAHPSAAPQGNGGDQDADNNGGPTDGDGNI